MTTFRCLSDILVMVTSCWLFTARWSTWPGNHLVPCVEDPNMHESGCMILPTRPHMGPCDFQVRCSIELKTVNKTWTEHAYPPLLCAKRSLPLHGCRTIVPILWILFSRLPMLLSFKPLSGNSLLLLLVCMSFTITGQPRNSVLIRRV